MQQLWKLWCWAFGHRRGRRMTVAEHRAGFTAYQCPRCHATWTRKVKAKEPK